MRTRFPILLTSIIFALSGPLIPTTASADEGSVPSGTGGDVSSGQELPAGVQEQAADKGAVAAAYVAAKDGHGSTAAFEEARQDYMEQYDVSMPVGNALKAARAGRRIQASRILAVDQHPQINGYFCGPAAGKSILAFLNAGPSNLNGAPQFQVNIGGDAHMRTETNGKTGWDSGLFRIGLNKWISGQPTGAWVQNGQPTPWQFRNALEMNIDSNQPFSADTVELQGGAHYNSHPQTGENIGHWIVAYGYSGSGDSTRFADPSTSIWGGYGVQPYFPAATDSFVNTYLSINGIVW